MKTNLSLPKRIFRLFISLTLLVFIVYLAQFPVQYIPAFNTYAEGAKKYNLIPGALYYSDVPVTMEAEQYNRAAIARVDAEHRQKRIEHHE